MFLTVSDKLGLHSDSENNPDKINVLHPLLSFANSSTCVKHIAKNIRQKLC